MSMLTLQVLALLLLFGLIGALLGWLIRPFFCKPGSIGGRGNLSGSANAKMGTPDTSVKASVDTSYAKGKSSASNKGKADNAGNGGGKAAAAVGVAAAAATAAAVSASNKKNDASDKAKASKQAAMDAEKKKLAAEAQQKADKAKADQAAAAEKAKAAKIAEEQRLAAEKAKAAKAAEEQRAAAEKAKAAKLAEEKRLADEKAKADQAAKAAAIEADKKKLAAEAEAARKAEADRLAAEKAKADQAAKDAAAKAEADRVAAEKAKADQAAKDAAAKAEADRAAAEKAKAEQAAKDAAAKAEADRVAAEKAKAEQAAKDAAAKAEADRVAAEKAKADQAAKDAAAKAEADRAAAEKAKAEQAAKDAAAKAEADRIAAEQKAKADQAAKDAAARADQAAKDAAAEKANAAKLAAAAATAAAATAVAAKSGASDSDEFDYASVTDDMRPDRLSAPRGGKADDLKRISGIGPVIEGTLNEEGVYHFQQIADFTPDNIKWVDKNVSIPGRVERDDWIGQAQSLIDGREYDGYAKDIAGTDDPSLPPVTEDMRPAKLAGPIAGKADDLKRINGVGPVIEKTLNAEGIYHFKQIADFTPDNVNWVDRHISFPGRITREEWIRQAKGLAAGSDAGSGAGGSSAGSDGEEIVVTENMRPTRRSLSAGQKGDDLKVINGIGPVIEKSLNEEGIHFYQQIADFDDDNTKWVDNHMAFPGRIHREDWIGQAKVLVGQGAGGNGSGDAAEIVVTENMRPTRRSLSAGQKGDDLKVINGIGPVIEKSLNEEGIHFYQQIADFDDDNTKWVDNHMAFPGRIHREDWIGQAKVLVGQGAGGNGSGDAAEIVVTENMRPTRRTLGSGEKADDLKVINGIGPVIEEGLNKEGIYFYQQIADFDDDNTKWVDNHMAFPGRIHREDWIGQAKVLVGQKGSSAGGSGKGGSGDSAKPAMSAVGSALGSSGAVPDSMKPTLLTAPEGGKADDLKRIKGIGKVLEKNLHEMGIYHYEQLAELTPDNIAWLTDYVSFPEGRINDEKWTSQAKALADGKQTEYSQRFDKGDTPYK